MSKLLEKLARRCFDNAEEQSAFVASLLTPSSKREAALIWLGDSSELPPFPTEPREPWEADFIFRTCRENAPGQHPLHEEGGFYILDPSSAFAASALLVVEGNAKICLDLCASPGGKSIFALRALKPELLIANEVIANRMPQLISNFNRCATKTGTTTRSKITSSDPGFFASILAGAVDVVIVDAPCTGQSLLAKGKPNPGCFHPNIISQNMRRQRRILAESITTLAPGGYLAYMTCTFSPEENEENLAWILKKFPFLIPCPVTHLEPFQSHLTTTPCYRLWPHRNHCAGSFVALVRKDPSEGERKEPGEFRSRWSWDVGGA